MASDPVKGWIASEVAASVDFFERRGIPQDNVVEVTVTHPTEMESQVRVKLRVGGTRYFTVKVSENY